MELLCLKVFASYLEGQTHKVFCSDLWLLAYDVFICRRQRLCGFGGKDLLFTACLRHLEEKTTKMRLTSCPPLTSSIANTKCVAAKIHRKYHALYSFLDLGLCLLRALGNTGKT